MYWKKNYGIYYVSTSFHAFFSCSQLLLRQYNINTVTFPFFAWICSALVTLMLPWLLPGEVFKTFLNVLKRELPQTQAINTKGEQSCEDEPKKTNKKEEKKTKKKRKKKRRQNTTTTTTTTPQKQNLDVLDVRSLEVPLAQHAGHVSEEKVDSGDGQTTRAAHVQHPPKVLYRLRRGLKEGLETLR